MWINNLLQEHTASKQWSPGLSQGPSLQSIFLPSLIKWAKHPASKTCVPDSVTSRALFSVASLGRKSSMAIVWWVMAVQVLCGCRSEEVTAEQRWNKVNRGSLISSVHMHAQLKLSHCYNSILEASIYSDVGPSCLGEFIKLRKVTWISVNIKVPESKHPSENTPYIKLSM